MANSWNIKTYKQINRTENFNFILRKSENWYLIKITLNSDIEELELDEIKQISENKFFKKSYLLPI